MSRRLLLPALILAIALCGAARADEPLGVIKGPNFAQAKASALAWLTENKADAATLQRAEELWNPAADRPLLDRVAETLLLGDTDARALITMLRDPASPAPQGVPEYLKDAKRSAFLRANLGLYFARQLATKRTYDETLEAIKLIRPEQVVDPASYYFFRAVAENKLRLRDEGLASVNRLLNSVQDAPERYTVVANLMKAEMEQWEQEDLGDIARRMHEIEDRLEIARGGPKTQQKQKEVLALLDKKIKQLEDQC
jgi:hypothetical protein